MIFENPPLASAPYDLAGHTLTLYEFTADLYYEHLLIEEGVRAIQAAQKAKTEEGESDKAAADVVEATAEAAENSEADIIAELRKDKDYRYTMVACSLAPGYPGRSVPELRDELKLNLTNIQLRGLCDAVSKLQGLSDPKQDAPATTSDTSLPAS